MRDAEKGWGEDRVDAGRGSMILQLAMGGAGSLRVGVQHVCMLADIKL